MRGREVGPVLAVLVLILAAYAPLEAPKVDTDTPPVTGSELTVTGMYEVSGVETYDRIRLGTTGTLAIPMGASLVGTVLTMQGTSRLEMTGGTLLLRADVGGETPGLTGSCQYMDLTDDSSIRVLGGGGTTYPRFSAGARAVVDVEATSYITISTSTVEVVGGNGLSPKAPLTRDDIYGDYCSGGDAVLSLRALGHDSAVNIRSSTLHVHAGNGGDAPDGNPSAGTGTLMGGGYSYGGAVGGRIGAGGLAWFNMSGDQVFLDTSLVTIVAGNGGDAGDGGDIPVGTTYGAGGGGYSGGSGSGGAIDIANHGGRVFGDVGSGGDVWMSVLGHDYEQVSTHLSLRAGDGGDAGNGGDSDGLGGAGGGGYSGGGGGSTGEPQGGKGHLVSDRVGSGGDARASLLLDEDVRMTGSTLDILAGSGGNAGNGGTSTHVAGAGGGGYSGGGGAGTYDEPGFTGKSMYGGDGSPVENGVASGGDAVLRVNSTSGYLEANTVRAVAGEGGQGGRAGRSWQDADTDRWLGGGGGGSYSAGGGGSYGEDSLNPRGGGEGGAVSGSVGDGGDSSLRMEIVAPTIHADNDILSSKGDKGPCWRSTAPGDTGGEGVGRFTRDGRAHTHIPNSRTILLTPPNGYESKDLPLFSWTPVHGSTANGRLVYYSIEVALDISFEILIAQTTVENSSINFSSLKKGQLYWRVIPLFTRPDRYQGLPSLPFAYTHLNSPPQVDEVPQVNITVRVPKTVDLYPYIRDLDDDFEDLVISYDSNKILWCTGLVVTFIYDRYQPPHDIHFNVTDGLATTSGRIPVRIQDDNHPPVLTRVGDINPPVRINIAEGETKTFKVHYYDRDGDPVKIRLITPWYGISLVENETIEIEAEFGDVGTYEAVIKAEDDRGGVSQLTMTVRVGNVGEPPEVPVFKHPANGSRYQEGDAVMFTIGLKDPDFAFGSPVTLTVISNVSGVLLTIDALDDVTFTTDELGPGRHLITAIVKDGPVQKRASMTLVVVADPEPSTVWEPIEDLWLVLGLLVAAFATLVVSYMLGFRRRKVHGRP